jgi:hypothetical protein
MPLIIEMINIVESFPPVNIATGANTGDWVNVSNYKRFAVMFGSGVGTAGDDPILNLQQATSSAGAGAKVLNFTTLWKKQAATSLAGTAAWTKVTQAAAATYTHTDAAEESLIWVVEFEADMLDVDGGFKFVQASVPDVGAGGVQGGCCYWLLADPRYPSDPTSQVSAIA